MEKKYYYDHHLGQCAEIDDYRIDKQRNVLIYRIAGTTKWHTDLIPLKNPAFFDSKTECMDDAKKKLDEELTDYNLEQYNIKRDFEKSLTAAFEKLDVLMWSGLRNALGKDKCKLLAEMLLADDEAQEEA